MKIEYNVSFKIGQLEMWDNSIKRCQINIYLKIDVTVIVMKIIDYRKVQRNFTSQNYRIKSDRFAFDLI